MPRSRPPKSSLGDLGLVRIITVVLLAGPFTVTAFVGGPVIITPLALAVTFVTMPVLTATMALLWDGHLNWDGRLNREGHGRGGAATRRGRDHGDLRGARRGDVHAGDGRVELGAAHEGRAPGGAVPLHDGRRNEVTALDRQREGGGARGGAARRARPDRGRRAADGLRQDREPAE